jgi:hypothetical protein
MCYAITRRDSVVASGNTKFGILANSGYQLDGSFSVGGWSDMTDFYVKGWVIGGRARATVSYTATSNVCHAAMGITTVSTSPITIREAIVAGRSTWGTFSPGGPALELQAEWDVSEVLAKPRILDDPELASFKAATPINQIYLYLLYNNPGTVTISVDVALQVELTITFTDPVPIVV